VKPACSAAAGRLHVRFRAAPLRGCVRTEDELNTLLRQALRGLIFSQPDVTLRPPWVYSQLSSSSATRPVTR
jgi:hypothetical protein